MTIEMILEEEEALVAEEPVAGAMASSADADADAADAADADADASLSNEDASDGEESGKMAAEEWAKPTSTAAAVVDAAVEVANPRW